MSLAPHLIFGLIVLIWTLGCLKILAVRRDPRFKLTGEEAPPEGGARVAVIVPARDEVKHIEACVEHALAQDHAELKVFILDDGSTDGTGEVLARLQAAHPERLRVLTGGDAPLPEGWMGKPWACQRAGEAALADPFAPEWMLFTDADVRLSPCAVRAGTGYAAREGIDLLSGFGQLTMLTFWERVMQPVVIGMIMNGNDLDRVNDPERKWGTPIANGQFILVRRAAWEQVGGHGAVRGNVLDDVGMAMAFEGAGLKLHATFMRPLFSCRMYDSLASLWEGWTKNIFAGMHRNWGILLFVVGFTAIFSVMPYVTAALGVAGVLPASWLWWSLGAIALIQAQRLYLDYSLGNPLLYGLTHAPACAMLMALLLHSGLKDLRGTATWKGRTIPSQA